MAVEDYRISKLRTYLFGIINELTENRNYQISADFLGKIGDFSLDKIPTDTEVENWIIGIAKKKDVYSFRSRKPMGITYVDKLKNIGFFEEFERIIKSNNDEGILPDIENIESIECLNCGTFNSQDGTQATFDIQIQITYLDNNKYNKISL